VIAFGNAVESDVAGGVPAREAALFRLNAIGNLHADVPMPVIVNDGRTTGATSGANSGALGAPGTPKRRP
jgi:hypothetical protein